MFSQIASATKSLITLQVLPDFGQKKMGRPSSFVPNPGLVFLLSVILADVKSFWLLTSAKPTRHLWLRLQRPPPSNTVVTLAKVGGVQGLPFRFRGLRVELMMDKKTKIIMI